MKVGRTRPEMIVASATNLARREWLVTLVVLLLAALVRVYGLGVEDFWQDEIHSMYNSACARGPAERIPHGVILHELPRHFELTSHSTLPNVWRTMDDDSHPPIYFMLLLLWRRCVGDAEVLVRLLPVFFSVLSILPAMGLLRELGHRRAAVITGLMMALGFCHINMGQDNRPYSLSGLLVGASFYFTVLAESRWERWDRRKRIAWMAGLATTLFAAMMNHYFAGFALVGLAAYVMIRWRGAKLRAWILASVSAGVLFCMVWGPHILKQREFIASQEWLIEDLPEHSARTFLRAADLPVRFLVRVNRFLVNEVTAAVGFAAMVLIAGFLLKKKPRGALLFACWYVVPILIFAAIDLATKRQQLTHFRYMSMAIPGLCGMLALVLEAAPRLARLGGLAAVGVVMFPTILFLPAQDNPHARTAVRVTQTGRGANDLLILDTIGWPSYSALRLYQMLSYYLPVDSQPILLLSEAPSAELSERIRTFDQVYVVSPREDLPDLYAGTFPFFEHSEYFREIGVVYRCRRGPPAAQPLP